MAEDEAIEDRNMGGPSPRGETRVRLGATDVMSWGIKIEIVCSSEIR